MSKGRGKKIVVKFDKALLGDVAGNHTAFTVTGMQKNPLFHGELQQRQYNVASVERYPTAQLWQDDFEGGDADGVEVGVNGITLVSQDSPALSFGGSHTVTMPETSIYDTGAKLTVEMWYKTSSLLSGVGLLVRHLSNYKYIAPYLTGSSASLAFYVRTNSGVTAPTWSPGAATLADGKWHHVACVYDKDLATSRLKMYFDGELVATADGFNENILAGAEGLTVGRWGTSYFVGQLDDIRVWNVARTQQQIQDNKNSELVGTESGLVGYWKLNEGTGTTAYDSTVNAKNGTISGATWTTREAGHESPGTYIPPPVSTTTLPANPRLRFDTDAPADTSITAEYAVTDSDTTPPETWTEVSDGDLLTIDGDFLWLRYTLETEDTAVTPTLLKYPWIEEAEAPPDKIILHFDEANRFNDVEGDITVAYDQNVGNLSGLRPVESFEESFTPEDLEPSPVDEHIITVRGEPVVDFINVTYEPGYEAHTVTVTGTGVFVDFIHVDDIPP